MKNFTLLLVVCFFSIFSLSAQTVTNSVAFSGATPKLAITGGKVVLNVDINIADAKPGKLMIGLVKLDATNKILGAGPIVSKIISLTDVPPYSKLVSDTIAIPADLALSSTLAVGERYAYFASILSSAFAPIQMVFSDVTIVDASTGNNVAFSPVPIALVMQGNDALLNVDLTVIDAKPGKLMIGLVKLDAANKILGTGPIVSKIITLTGGTPYSKLVSATVTIPADQALSSTLAVGERYAYFASILTSAFSPIKMVFSDVTIVEVANNVVFSPAPVALVMQGKDVLLNVGLTVADAKPGKLMIGLVKLDAANKILGTGPIVSKIITLTDVAPYSKLVSETITIPADQALSSTLAVGERYAYFTSILSSAFAPIKMVFSDVTIVEVANNVVFSPAPVALVMQGKDVLLNVGLTVADAKPGKLMIGLVKLDAANKILGTGPIVSKIITLTDVAPYSKLVSEPITIPADQALSSTLAVGERYAYFTSILSSAFSPIKMVFSDVTIVEVANNVVFSPAPVALVMQGKDVLLNVGLTVADANPGKLMIGLVKLDAANKILGTGPIVSKIITLTDIAPYSKLVSEPITIPTDLALSSTLAVGERYAYFTSILTSAFAPIKMVFSDVTVSSITSVNEKFNNRIKLYPNPATDRLQILGLQANEQLEIYNIAGTLVLNTILSSTEIDVSGLKTGIYFMKGKSFVLKFIKQ